MKEQLIHCRRRGKNIKYDLVLGEEDGESLSEFPFDEEIRWLYQYHPVAMMGIYLVEAVSHVPVRIWVGAKNDVNTLFKCIWEAKEEDDG